MARIKTYNIDTLLSDNDKVIGTDVDSFNQTKNYKLSDIRSYVISGLSPEVGGTLKISEIVYEGVLNTPEGVANALNPDYSVSSYETLFFNVNGNLYLLNKTNINIGSTQTALTSSDFIEFPVSVGPQGEQGEQGEPGEDGVSVVASGLSINVTGTGTEADPYIPNLVNLQKTVSSFPYTLTSGDDKYTIFVNNSASNVAINIPTGLVSNFTASFIQKGTGDVSINNNVGVNLEHPSTLQNIIKGQYYGVMLEKEIATENYYLIGGLKLS